MFLKTRKASTRPLPRATLPALTPLVLALSLAVPGMAVAAGALPSGGQFVAGTGSINGNAHSLTVNQTSTRGIIDWNSFSIGGGNAVNINNGSGATLNRVTGATPSSILGTLSATGSLYLINPQGVVIGQSGVVTTRGRFVASTLDVDNNAFMNGGVLTLTGTPGSSNSTIVNLGKISSSGGDVFLIASNEVDNVGAISTPNGSTELAAGQQVLLQDSTSTRQIFVQSGSSGKVVNRGAIQAAQISLQAADGNVYALAGNHSVLRATGTATRDGHVWLTADTGRVWLDGTVEARNADGSGGTLDTNATTLRIAGGPTVKANLWNITTPSFTIDGLAAPVFQSNLDRGTSINLQTTGANGVTGDIDVASSIHWTGAASLTLGAYHSITIEAAAYVKNCGTGNLTLRADSQAIDNGGSVTNNGTIDWSASRGIVSAFYDMNGTYTPGKVVANQSWTAPAYSGLVTQITAYKLVNSLTDLENVNADLAGNYALGKDIDASATSDGSYVPIGRGASFTGQLDGEGHTINSLSIQALLGTGSDGQPLAMGLFDTLGTGAVVRNLNVNANTSISSYDFLSTASGVEGILAAYNYGTIVGVNTSGSISNFGGLTSYFFFDNTQAGGLVGQNHGTIERSSSSASVATGATSGGLVGENDGLIFRSYASGSVGGFEIGNGPGNDKAYTEASPGGLVGTNNGTISQSYVTSSVSNPCANQSCSAAALVYTNNGTITQSFAAGSGPGPSGLTAAYGIAVTNNGTIANDVYWNRDTTNTTSGVGSGTGVPASNGLSASQMSTPSSYAGYDFGANGVWAMPANATHPVLQWQLTPPTGGS